MSIKTDSAQANFNIRRFNRLHDRGQTNRAIEEFKILEAKASDKEMVELVRKYIKFEIE